jgi:peptidoglycan/LPS O-acetylase OafA/YrhL
MSLKAYRPELDGLRACAVIPVILFHLDSLWLRGGYIGVDVFFVISGFLITSIILDEHDRGVFKFPNFWLRRIRRIFPALAAMLIASSIAAYFISFRPDLFSVGKHGIAAVLSFANIAMMNVGSYWGDTADHSQFLHTWSLSVEEQFYLLYPFVVYGLMKLGRKWVGRGIAFVALCSLAAYVVGSRKFPDAAFYLLPTRAWELASGCLAAVAKWRGRLRSPKGLSPWLSTAGLALVVASYFLIEGNNRYIGALTVPVLGAASVILFGEDDASPAKRILSFPPLVYIGKISYSLYLWHWPIIVLARQRSFLDGSVASEAIVLIAIAIASVLSYLLVEKPTRSRKKILVPAFCGLLASLSISAYLYLSILSYDCSRFSAPTWLGQRYNVNPVDDWDRSIRRRMAGVNAPPRDPSVDKAYLSGGIIRQYGGSVPEVVVLGDSHALMWSGIIDEICERQGKTVSFYCADATNPFMSIPPERANGNQFFTAEQRLAFDEARLRLLSDWKPKTVILAARWSFYSSMEDNGPLLRFLGGLGSRVLLVEQPPELSFGSKNAMQYLAFMGIMPVEGKREYIAAPRSGAFEAGREFVRNASAAFPFCSFMEVDDVIGRGEAEALVLDGSKVMYIDDNHLSLEGTALLKERLTKAIASSRAAGGR